VEQIVWPGKREQKDFALERSNRKYIMTTTTRYCVFLDDPVLVLKEIAALHKNIFPYVSCRESGLGFK
jgi:hypothetical protein